MKQIELGSLNIDDFQQLLVAMKAAYPGWNGNFWTPESIKKLIDKFPERQGSTALLTILSFSLDQHLEVRGISSNVITV